MVRIERQGLAKIVDGKIRLAQSLVGVSPVEIGQGIPAIFVDGRIEGCEGFRRLASGQESASVAKFGLNWKRRNLWNYSPDRPPAQASNISESNLTNANNSRMGHGFLLEREKGCLYSN